MDRGRWTKGKINPVLGHSLIQRTYEVRYQEKSLPLSLSVSVCLSVSLLMPQESYEVRYHIQESLSLSPSHCYWGFCYRYHEKSLLSLSISLYLPLSFSATGDMRSEVSYTRISHSLCLSVSVCLFVSVTVKIRSLILSFLFF